MPHLVIWFDGASTCLPSDWLGCLTSTGSLLRFSGGAQDLVDRIFVEQIKELEVAEDIMTAPVQTCGPMETIEEVSK